MLSFCRSWYTQNKGVFRSRRILNTKLIKGIVRLVSRKGLVLFINHCYKWNFFLEFLKGDQRSLLLNTYTAKKIFDFPVPSWDVPNQTLPGREKFNYSRPGRVWLVTSPAGDGKIDKLFLQCTVKTSRVSGKSILCITIKDKMHFI